MDILNIFKVLDIYIYGISTLSILCLQILKIKRYYIIIIHFLNSDFIVSFKNPSIVNLHYNFSNVIEYIILNK